MKKAEKMLEPKYTKLVVSVVSKLHEVIKETLKKPEDMPMVVTARDLEKNKTEICSAWDENNRIKDFFLERGYPASYKSDIKEPIEIRNATNLLEDVYKHSFNYVMRSEKVLPVITEMGMFKSDGDLFVAGPSVAVKDKIIEEGGPFLELAHSYFKKKPGDDEIEKDPMFQKFMEFLSDPSYTEAVWNPATYIHWFDLVDDIYVLNSCPGLYAHHTHPIRLPPEKEDIIIEGYDITLLHFPNDQEYKPVAEEVNIVWLPYDLRKVKNSFSNVSSEMDAKKMKKQVIEYHLDNVGKGEVIGIRINPDRTQAEYRSELMLFSYKKETDLDGIRKRSPYRVDFHPLTMPQKTEIT